MYPILTEEEVANCRRQLAEKSVGLVWVRVGPLKFHKNGNFGLKIDLGLERSSEILGVF